MDPPGEFGFSSLCILMLIASGKPFAMSRDAIIETLKENQSGFISIEVEEDHLIARAINEKSKEGEGIVNRLKNAFKSGLN